MSNQYYGIDKEGKSVYVAMSVDEVKNYAKKHPKENIVKIQDSKHREYELNEALKLHRSLTESFKSWDKKEFDENSNTYELEMLYESNKNFLSSKQKKDLSDFVRKAKTAEEINTYMTGMLAQGSINEDYEEDLVKLKEIFYLLEKKLDEEGVWIEDMWYNGYDNNITVSIRHGDWKHDHLRADYIIRNFLDSQGIKYNIYHEDNDEDEYDGSDVYSAYHIIQF